MTPDEVPSDFVRNRLKHTPDEYLQNHAYMLDQSIAQVFSHNDPPEWIWHQMYALYYGLLATRTIKLLKGGHRKQLMNTFC